MADDGSKSRTQKKKEDRALQQLGEQLVTLSADALKAVAMPEELYDAVRMAQRTTRHGARRRQLQTIGALMRKIDPEPIRVALDRHRRGDAYHKALFKRLERWRNALVDGDGTALEEILAGCPGAERRELSDLVDRVRDAPDRSRASAASRVLFRYLRKACEDKDL